MRSRRLFQAVGPATEKARRPCRVGAAAVWSTRVDRSRRNADVAYSLINISYRPIGRLESRMMVHYSTALRFNLIVGSPEYSCLLFHQIFFHAFKDFLRALRVFVCACFVIRVTAALLRNAN